MAYPVKNINISVDIWTDGCTPILGNERSHHELFGWDLDQPPPSTLMAQSEEGGLLIRPQRHVYLSL